MLLADNLSTRMTAILLTGLAVMLLIGATLLVWPQGGGEGGVRFYQLPRPSEARAIVEAVEASPPAARTKVITALDTGVIRTTLRPDFPPLRLRARIADDRDPGYQAYRAALGGRELRIDIRRGGRLRDGALPGRHALLLSVRLTDGEVLVLRRRAPETARLFFGRVSLAAAALLAVTLLMLTLAVRQTTRPVTLLAREVARFGDDLNAKVLPLRGPRELRELSAAFNTMRDQIRGLMDERTRMLAAIAHDLRTYLTRLTLRAEFIADETQRAKAGADLAEMAQLLDDTLLFARQDAGRGDGARAIDLRRELETLVALRREMGQTVVLAPDIAARVWSSPLALRRMLDNLIDNAVRYGGAVTLDVRRQEGQVEIMVLDDGPGLPAEALATLTAPFERGESSRNRRTGGAGLGLSIVQALAKGQGGRLILSNRPEGGLAATITLPSDTP
ncbi:ATP-binding protein [Caulobacter sp. 602-1]|uniref:ATP-binding protein n=1 Tax=Caulobacter sp. 602-1 TaxID=2492472 RepID=UPI000F6430F8|nr:ATP-binding protein [Caulobacter sp. 602-1]RRN63350.1 HAMP domain-containing protein [Caulobacter sp. 602-1]